MHAYAESERCGKHFDIDIVQGQEGFKVWED
jgi:hypothetical protein